MVISTIRPRPFDYVHSTALVTGASRGIGAALARELVHRGIGTLVLTARSTADLEKLATELRAARPAGLRVEVIAADLAEANASAQVKKETDRLGLTIDLLVNNAGFGMHGPFHTLDVEQGRAMVAVNVDAVVALTGQYYPGMQERGRGGIINVASTAAFQPVPFMTTYAATKAFVLTFSEGLWAEARERGSDLDLRVVALCPGDTDTDFGDGMDRGSFESSRKSTPEEVATAGLDALNKNASYTVVGMANYLGVLSERLAPRATVARVAANMFRPEGFGGQKKVSRNTPAVIAIGAGVAAVAAVGATLIWRRRRS